jgi:hypothetical protein
MFELPSATGHRELLITKDLVERPEGKEAEILRWVERAG